MKTLYLKSDNISKSRQPRVSGTSNKDKEKKTKMFSLSIAPRLAN